MNGNRRAMLGGAALMVVALAGCGGSVSVGTSPDKLAGKEVAAKANKALEDQNPAIAHGTMTCPSMRFKVDESVRCTRTATLEDGRQVKVGVSVTVDRVKDGGHFKISADNRAESFGISGDFIAKDLTQQYVKQFGKPPKRITCPDLPGELGAKVTCKVSSGGDHGTVEVTATKVDEARFDTDYTFNGQDVPAP